MDLALNQSPLSMIPLITQYLGNKKIVLFRDFLYLPFMAKFLNVKLENQVLNLLKANIILFLTMSLFFLENELSKYTP